VSAFGISTLTDTQGHYVMSFLPLGTSAVSVREPASRGIGQSPAVTLDQQGQTKTATSRCSRRARSVVTVRPRNHAPVPSRGSIGAGAGFASDTSGRYDRRDGTAIVDHVIVGPFSGAGDCRHSERHVHRNVDGDAQKTVLVQLEPTASITGDREGAQRRAGDCGYGVRAPGVRQLLVPIGRDGTIRVDNLNFGSYL